MGLSYTRSVLVFLPSGLNGRLWAGSSQRCLLPSRVACSPLNFTIDTVGLVFICAANLMLSACPLGMVASLLTKITTTNDQDPGAVTPSKDRKTYIHFPMTLRESEAQKTIRVAVFDSVPVKRPE
ncbi:MAG: hypothetical protein Q9168_004594 [Polycauliona sp. 1 TL-2023]